MIDYTKFWSSLKRLEEQHANYRQGNPALSDLDREAIAESVVQRFETCYDCLWKSPEALSRPRRSAVAEPRRTAPSPSSGSHTRTTCSPRRWSSGSNTPKLRIDTSHDYDGEKAEGLPRPRTGLHRRRPRPLPDHDW